MSVTVDKKITNTGDLKNLKERLLKEGKESAKTIRICIGTGCTAKGAEKIYELFSEAVAQSDRDITIDTKCVGCHGFCELGPIVVIDPGDIFYHGVEEPDVEEIFRETVIGNRIIERLLYKDEQREEKAQTEANIPFYKNQKRIVLKGNGRLNPRDIDDYIANDGYTALAKALTMTPDAIIQEVDTAGLRGRGGGGFRTARKWRSCREAHGDVKYVICNGDEGDPGAFMDRSIMEGNPHSVIEGLIIGAYAIGASHGYIYVRNEYPLAVEHLTTAIKQATDYGFLGENILGSGLSFTIRINRGGGAFVCGESTALIASLEGKIGEPKAKYVHTVESGLKRKPTVLNNVETWANIPAIITNGGVWFASIGTAKSKGTKVFSLVGKVKNTGLVEVPMGMSLRQIIYDIGGGIRDGGTFKAVQTGGPSGGCIPAEYLDAPVDFDELIKLGSMMGSGGMIVMDESTCMVDFAKYFMEFLKAESCGKCTPCREGISQILHILTRISRGEGKEGDIELLETLASLLEKTALCALGKTAAYPVLSTLRYFKDEYVSHIKDNKCPAHVCKGLFRYHIDREACKGCLICAKNCPVNAITGEKKQPHVINQETCTLCGVCFEKCPFNAVTKV
jgi:NADH-quinone oxidoreductase subunit F